MMLSCSHSTSLNFLLSEYLSSASTQSRLEAVQTMTQRMCRLLPQAQEWMTSENYWQILVYSIFYQMSAYVELNNEKKQIPDPQSLEKIYTFIAQAFGPLPPYKLRHFDGNQFMDVQTESQLETLKEIMKSGKAITLIVAKLDAKLKYFERFLSGIDNLECCKLPSCSYCKGRLFQKQNLTQQQKEILDRVIQAKIKFIFPRLQQKLGEKEIKINTIEDFLDYHQWTLSKGNSFLFQQPNNQRSVILHPQTSMIMNPSGAGNSVIFGQRNSMVLGKKKFDADITLSPPTYPPTYPPAYPPTYPPKSSVTFRVRIKNTGMMDWPPRVVIKLTGERQNTASPVMGLKKTEQQEVDIQFWTPEKLNEYEYKWCLFMSTPEKAEQRFGQQLLYKFRVAEQTLRPTDPQPSPTEEIMQEAQEKIKNQSEQRVKEDHMTPMNLLNQEIIKEAYVKLIELQVRKAVADDFVRAYVAKKPESGVDQIISAFFDEQQRQRDLSMKKIQQ